MRHATPPSKKSPAASRPRLSLMLRGNLVAGDAVGFSTCSPAVAASAAIRATDSILPAGPLSVKRGGLSQQLGKPCRDRLPVVVLAHVAAAVLPELAGEIRIRRQLIDRVLQSLPVLGLDDAAAAGLADPVGGLAP